MTAANRADLHVHTEYSDGSLSPAEVVAAARAAGLRAVAITDHDTMEGLADLPEAPRIEVVPGIECKADWEGEEIHVLGYGADWALLRAHARFDLDREERNAAVIALLRAAGVDISLEELKARKKGVVGRPHIAALLVEKGRFPTVRAAFDEWLAEGRPFYAPIARQSVPELAAALRGAGAKVVLAHPLQYGFSDERLRRLVRACADSGFHGMETVYSGYAAAQSALLGELAASMGLCPTGGSDFHGPRRPDRVIGSAAVPYAWLEALRERTD